MFPSLVIIYGAAHVSLFVFGGLLVGYLASGSTDYGGATGFLPGHSLGAFDDPNWMKVPDPSGGGIIGNLRLLLAYFDLVAKIPAIMVGFFIFDYPVLDAGGGSFSWIKTAAIAIGTASSMAMSFFLLRLLFASGILSNRWGLAALGLTSLAGIGSVIF